MAVILKNNVTVFNRQRRLRMTTIPDRDLSDAYGQADCEYPLDLNQYQEEMQ